jgi:GNAT superfamily N-acetyltransferase
MHLHVGWWWARCRATADAPARIVFVHGNQHADGTAVDWPHGTPLPAAEDGAWGVAVLDDLGLPTDIHLATDAFAPKARPVWFCEVRELTADPPAVNLLAFTGAGVRAGRVLDEPAAREAGATTADQVGAVRWWPASGEIDQIYVQPQWRRRHVATVLLHAAAMLSVARGWARLWSDGQRTELGEQLRNARDWRQRAAELTHVAPPMTLGEHFDEVQTERWVDG